MQIKKLYRKITRRCITLVELLIVMAILILTAGVIGVNVSKTLTSQRFRSEVDQIVDQMRLAQDLMLILHGNIHLRFARNAEDSGFNLTLRFDNPLPHQWARELKHEKRKLSNIRVIEFETDVPNHSPLTTAEYGDVGTLDLEFLSGGSMMSQGILRLSTGAYGSSENILERYILLPGYPAPITSSAERPSKEVFTADAGFNRELTFKTMEEIRVHKEEL